MRNAETLDSLDDHLHRPVVAAHDAQDARHGPCLVELPRDGFFYRRIARRQEPDEAVTLHGLFDELDRAGNSYRERDHGKATISRKGRIGSSRGTPTGWSAFFGLKKLAICLNVLSLKLRYA